MYRYVFAIFALMVWHGACMDLTVAEKGHASLQSPPNGSFGSQASYPTALFNMTLPLKKTQELLRWISPSIIAHITVSLLDRIKWYLILQLRYRFVIFRGFQCILFIFLDQYLCEYINQQYCREKTWASKTQYPYQSLVARSRLLVNYLCEPEACRLRSW